MSDPPHGGTLPPSGPPPGQMAPGLLAAVVIFLLVFGATLSLDPARVGFGLRGDESTYIAMGLSAAYDHDLVYQKKDLERFWSYYPSGPEGIFLKRGSKLRVSFESSWPFIFLDRLPDDRLYFGKAYSYPLAAAPFVRMAGLRGFYILHALLLATSFLAAYAFLAAHSGSRPALLFSSAFFGVSVLPTYVVRYYSDFFIFALVLFGYFFWLYKEVARPADGRWSRLLRSPSSDLLAVLMLGLATYTKPINLLLGAPIVLTLLWRRQWRRSMKVGLAYACAILVFFVMTAAISGEANYQGGDRKTFYGKFPLESPRARFDNCGTVVTTSSFHPEDAFSSTYVLRQFARNWVYFFIGRHAGLIPFFFPGFLVIVLWLTQIRGSRCWQIFVALTVIGTQSVSMLWMAHNWAGGGGQPGNRYFLSLYPTLLFLLPATRSIVPALAAWAGGALFVAHLLVNPFAASAMPWTNTQHGLLHLLPVELTMPNDLPIMLNQARSRVLYGENPPLRLYFLDENASLPELGAIWVAGRSKTEILVRTGIDVPSFAVSLTSPIPNTVTLRAGAAVRTTTLSPGTSATIDLPAHGLLVEGGYSYLLEVETTEGFVPRLADPSSRESRYLGVSMRLAAKVTGPVVFP